MTRPVAAGPHRRIPLTKAAIACAIASGCSSDVPLVSPDLDSPGIGVEVPSAAPAKAKDQPSADAIGAILDRLVPALDDYGLTIRNALLALQGRPSDRAAWDALLLKIDAIEVELPLMYLPDLNALRLELDVIVPR